MIVLLYFAGIIVAAWHLIFGFRAGSMTAMGQVYATAYRYRQPVRFWLFSVFNVLLLVAGIALIGNEIS